MNKTTLFVFGLPLTLMLVTLGANRALNLGQSTDNVPPMTAERLYDKTRNEIQNEFGTPCSVSHNFRNFWFRYEKRSTQLLVCFNPAGHAKKVIAVSLKADESGTLTQHWPPHKSILPKLGASSKSLSIASPNHFAVLLGGEARPEGR